MGTLGRRTCYEAPSSTTNCLNARYSAPASATAGENPLDDEPGWGWLAPSRRARRTATHLAHVGA